LKYLFPLVQWDACKLAKLSACIAKCMTTINKICIHIRGFLSPSLHVREAT